MLPNCPQQNLFFKCFFCALMCEKKYSFIVRNGRFIILIIFMIIVCIHLIGAMI